MVNKLSRSLLIYSCFLLASPVLMLSQTASTKINGVSEPPELTGEPKKFDKPSESDRQLFEIIGKLQDEDDTKSSMPKLDEFIAQHPDYSDAYFIRATFAACILKSRDFTSVTSDVKAAMSHSGQRF